MEKQSTPHWIESTKQRGYSQLMVTVLDIIEPIAPLVAQGLWVAQPFAGLVFSHTTIKSLAETLEDPDGVSRLRQWLSDDTQE